MSQGAGGGGGGSAGRGEFTPREDLVSALMQMGVSRNAAVRSLYHTGNSNADLAAAWIFEHQDGQLDTPLDLEESFDDDDDEAEIEGFLDEGDFYKMVLVVNTQLNMGVGKVSAQVGHAVLGVYKQMVEDQTTHGEMLLQWDQFGETKIVLKGNTAEHLMEMSAKASSLGLVNYLVQDAGKTQIAPGSVTVLGIMGKNDLVNQVTGELGLL